MTIKPISNGFIFKMGNTTQIYKGNRMVQIKQEPDCFTKTYINTQTMDIIKTIVEKIRGGKIGS